MTKMFRVSIDIPQPKLAVVLQVLTKEGSNLKVDSVGDGPIETMRTRKPKSNSGKSPMTDHVIAEIRKLAPGTEFNRPTVEKWLKAGGFNPSNYSPIMSKLAQTTNIITAPKKGVYKSTGK